MKDLGRGSLDKRCFVHFIKYVEHINSIPRPLTLSVDKTTTTSNTMQGPLRGCHETDRIRKKLFSGSDRLLAAKSTSFTAMAAAMQSVQNILHEISTNHKAFCIQWGVSEEELEEAPESTATTAYGAYIMDIGFQGDTVKLNMALAACLLGYGEVGLWLVSESKRPGSWVIMDESLNPYVLWIKEYSGEKYQKAVGIGLGALRVDSSGFPLNVNGVTATIEGIGLKAPVTQESFEEWVEIWRRCVLLEKGFWDMAIGVLHTC